MRSRLVVAALIFSASVASARLKVDKQNVTFMSGDLELAGTVYMPKSESPVPAVVLIHGSGRVDRSSMEYWAKIFAESGVAALAYDKRGVGKSQGPEFAWRDYDFDDLAADAAAGAAFLETRPGIDAERIGVFGASQGGWVAPLAAKRAKHVAFMVMVSASVTTTAEDNLFERDARLKGEGFTDAEIAEVHAMHLVDLEVSRSGSRFDEFTKLWEDNKSKRWFPRVYTGNAPAGPQHDYRKWYRTVMDMDPVPVLRELSIPVLWLYGDPSIDRFCPVNASMQALEALKMAGKPYDVQSFAGADHSLQMKGTDATFRPLLTQWLERHVTHPTSDLKP
jgi:pimeloyl-ACP methyl ester carboxylesterase